MNATRHVSAGAERLLTAAARHFGAKGYEGTAVRELLREAGVGPTVLYYHFGSKQGLYAAVLRRQSAEYAAALERAAAGSETVIMRIGRVCRVHAGRKPRADPARLVEILRSLVREGIDRGELSRCDPDAAAAALAGIASAPSDDTEPSALSFVLERLR